MKLDRRHKRAIKSLVVKHSMIVNGRDSSVSIEGAFWNALKEIAGAQNISANALVSKIDRERDVAYLSSAIRLYVLEHYRLAGPAMTHKFILGQGVGYTPPHGQYAPLGLYVVTAKLPERDGEFEYRIKHISEAHEHTARESELRWVKG
jgi:predicted DNA-binding ribbon-helix-helix protein